LIFGLRREHGEAEAFWGIMLETGLVAGLIVGWQRLFAGLRTHYAPSGVSRLRKQQVLEEGDAIGTSSLRAQLIPGPTGPEISSLLRQYVNVRVQNG
jgi:hypothetical protein